MTNEEFMNIMEIIHNCLRTDANNKFDLHPITKHAKKLMAVAEAAKALKGDFDAKDEQPTHFSSWFNFIDALEELERET